MITPYPWQYGDSAPSGDPSSSEPMVITMAPKEGQTVVVPITTQEVILNLEPADDLVELFLVLPANPQPREGQRVFVSSSRIIEQLIVTSSDTVNGGNVMYSPGDNYVWLQNKSSIWSRVKA